MCTRPTRQLLVTARGWIKRNVWLTSGIAFLMGVLLGPGAIWNYFSYDLAERSHWVESVKVASDLQRQLLSLQSDILDGTRPYVEARSAYFALKGKSDNEVIARFTLAKARMVKLISDYNAIEARLAILEKRQPVWFNFGGLLPPLPPQNLKAEVKDSHVVFTWDPPKRDPVVADVDDNLRSLYKQYGQEFSQEN